MNQLGQRITQLRLEKGLSRSQLCGDESILSVRQLARIENGESQPTVAKLEYIAEQLGVAQYTLVPDYKPLTKRYLGLKHYLLRQPAYNQEALREKREIYLEEIFENFYEDLPEEERLTIDIIQSMEDIHYSEKPEFGQGILDKYFEGVLEKAHYTLNDLLIIRLFLVMLSAELIHKEEISAQKQKYFTFFVRRFESYQDDLEVNELYLLRDLFLNILGCMEKMKSFKYFPHFIKVLHELMARDKDYQKKPIVTMLEWKYALAVEKDMTKATEKYQQAKMLAEMLDLAPIVKGLEYQWQVDLKKYL